MRGEGWAGPARSWGGDDSALALALPSSASVSQAGSAARAADPPSRQNQEPCVKAQRPGTSSSGPPAFLPVSPRRGPRVLPSCPSPRRVSPAGGPREDVRVPGQSQYPHQHPRRGTRHLLLRRRPRVPEVALRHPDDRGNRAGLSGVGPDCRHLLPAVPFLWLGDVCRHLLLAGHRYTLWDVPSSAPDEAVYDPMANRAGGVQHFGSHPVRHGFHRQRCLGGAFFVASFTRLQPKSLCLVLCLPGDDRLWGQRLPQHPGLERVRPRCNPQPSNGSQSCLRTTG